MRRLITLVAFACSAAACGTDDPVGDDEEEVNCDLETRDDQFGIGLQKLGDASTLSFKFMGATPAPPIRGDNAWILEVSNAGAPVSGATLRVTPYMPDHGHPSGKTVKIQVMPAAGQYQLDPLNFWMPGLWETTIDVESASGNDTVVFRFCVPA